MDWIQGHVQWWISVFVVLGLPVLLSRIQLLFILNIIITITVIIALVVGGDGTLISYDVLWTNDPRNTQLFGIIKSYIITNNNLNSSLPCNNICF
jgi:hypothetical protein